MILLNEVQRFVFIAMAFVAMAYFKSSRMEGTEAKHGPTLGVENEWRPQLSLKY